MKESTKLKPCPFCGNDVIDSRTFSGSQASALICCTLCGANLAADSMEAASEKWNTRHPDEDGVLKAMSVAERIRHAIDLDFCECGANRKFRIFISKDLFDALRRECVIAKNPKDVAMEVFCGHEFEIVDGANRLYLARKI